MNVRLDWQFDEDAFEDRDRPAPIRNGSTGATLARGQVLMGRDPELLRVGPIGRPTDRHNPAQLYLAGSLILFGALILLCLLP